MIGKYAVLENLVETIMTDCDKYRQYHDMFLLVFMFHGKIMEKFY